MTVHSEHDDFYRRLRARVKGWAQERTGSDAKWLEYALAAPDLFYLLVKLSLDDDVPMEHKVKLGVAIVYFISPIDLIPDFIPVVGVLDDVALAAYVLNGLLTSIDPAVVQRNWAGDTDVLVLVRNILDTADQMLGSGLWRRVRRMVK